MNVSPQLVGMFDRNHLVVSREPSTFPDACVWKMACGRKIVAKEPSPADRRRRVCAHCARTRIGKECFGNVKPPDPEEAW